MRIAIIAALPGELKPLVQGWTQQPSDVKGISVWTTERGDDELIAVSGGMGSHAALRSVTAAEFFGSPDLLLSVGWAGALNRELKVGECYVPAETIDVQTGERFFSAGDTGRLRLVTSIGVADAIEKRRLEESYGAALVDMEAATVARLAQMRDIPFVPFKGVSDAQDAELPDLNSFIDPQGQMQMVPFLAHVALRPGFWGPLMKLGKNSSLAAHAIARRVNEFLKTKKIETQ
ncbi:MAG TPA: nucleoside phosphorylase [Edaphobacter sp.]|jgi:adenosylhomocysteine nucleosidase